MRYFLEFSYDGTKFHGFQRQKDVKNVQSTIENVLSEVLNENIDIKGSGRTDALVHAEAQTATFDTTNVISKEQKISIVKSLANELKIKKINRVGNDFHARFSAKKKWYRYKINIGEYNKDFEGYYFQPKYHLDLKKMKEAKNVFLGIHDFRNFVSGSRENYITYIKKIKFKVRKNIIYIDFYGTSFYRYMVRNLVGSLLDVGKGKIEKEELKKMLDNPLIKRQLSTAPASGLYLMKVYY